MKLKLGSTIWEVYKNIPGLYEYATQRLTENTLLDMGAVPVENEECVKEYSTELMCPKCYRNHCKHCHCEKCVSNAQDNQVKLPEKIEIPYTIGTYKYQRMNSGQYIDRNIFPNEELKNWMTQITNKLNYLSANK